MPSRPLLEIAELLMRRKRLWITFVFSFIAAGFFYVSVVKEKIDLEAVVLVPRVEPSVLSLPINVATDIVESDVECPSGNVVYGNYCVISPYNEIQKNSTDLGVVTLCTQGTIEFLHHVIILCNRWNGPMSVAVYSPPEDYVDARTVVNLIRKCDFCVRQWVSWHFFYRKQRMPDIEKDSGPIIIDCHSVTSHGNHSRKRRSDGPYPINVGRNIARSKTFTPYIFSIDIELYPSIGVLPKFERMIRFSNVPNDHPQVWVLPVFEVHSKYRAPVTKFHLRNMYQTKQAISFHKYRCDECHRIPNLTQWLNKDSQMKSEEVESTEELRVWATVNRSRKFRLHFWEPFFIGTRDDPEFDPRLSWEGKQNKMQVAYEMCLRRYSFHIVENAFLVHSPGVNVYNATKEKHRFKYQHENDKWISIIRKNLTKKYGFNKDC
ncbi:beta-1,4-glucuronyltransferase 1 [Trichonephila clavata]|uniref:Beta-1,4-glucuronyltransferase 1 n=1 Tax=Trichonephila clavata TaxID=2740835 RepID=A0A8X6GAV4_TRICU|nr:beta-1,4-glucuronyltransferase 1 [Trichonephila clavata]